MNSNRVVIVGGGAAGFFCALKAASDNPSLDITIVEKSSKVLSKVRVSGGGRCNVTHACSSIAEMVKNYPRGSAFLKKTFYHFFVSDTIEWFEQRSVALKTEADGRMFPVSNSSETIIECLQSEASRRKIRILMNKDFKDLQRHHEAWLLTFNDTSSLSADYVCIACGGFPKLSQFSFLTNIGHTIEAPVPSLFTFNIPGHPLKALMGITREEVIVKIVGTKFVQTGPLLITHWGFSGPAILKLSAFAARELQQLNYDFLLQVNWLPSFNEQSLLEKFKILRVQLASQKMVNRNPFFLPQRLWEFFLETSGINENSRWADLPAKFQNILIKLLCTQIFRVNGKTTFKDEFVTAGGITLNEIEPSTMESRKIPHLYCCGEVIDVDGVTGGYNFQHAWTSGWIAGRAIAAGS